MEKRDCHNCGMPVSGNVCSLIPSLVNECLGSSDRVHWLDGMAKDNTLSEKDTRINMNSILIIIIMTLFSFFCFLVLWVSL